MVDLSNMTLFELRAYRAWLERTRSEDRADFKAEHIVLNDFDLTAEARWFISELKKINWWIDTKETEEARIKMEAKAKWFLGSKHMVSPSQKKPGPFRQYLIDLGYFFKYMFGIK